MLCLPLPRLSSSGISQGSSVQHISLLFWPSVSLTQTVLLLFPHSTFWLILLTLSLWWILLDFSCISICQNAYDERPVHKLDCRSGIFKGHFFIFIFFFLQSQCSLASLLRIWQWSTKALDVLYQRKYSQGYPVCLLSILNPGYHSLTLLFN